MSRKLKLSIIFLVVFVVALAAAVLAVRQNGADEQVAEDRADRAQAVVSAHELATDAGIEMLEAGGTAADAAVAVAAALSVVEPWFSSALGGGTWALYYDAEEDEVTSLDGVAPAGSNASISDYQAKAGRPGMHQAVVPGAWDGWMLWLKHYGRLDLGDILDPAIRIGREGYRVGPEMAEWLENDSDYIPNRPSTADIYAPDGDILSEGDTVTQTAMAGTFSELVSAYDEKRDEGRDEAVQAARDHYYRGPVAEAIVDFSDRFGGYLTRQDFENFEAEIVEAISIDYDEEIRVYQSPPNSQGITMLIALNILKGIDFSDLDPDSAAAIHLQTEALKLAFADRYYRVGDPDRVEVPVGALLSEAHADRQRERIDRNAAMEWPIEDGAVTMADNEAEHTTTFHITDKYGNAAAVTTSLGAQFLVVGDSGIHINNRMRFFSLEDGNPNQLAPGRKVRHTSNPYMAFKAGQLYMLGGNIGADTQAQAQVQQFLSVVAFGASAQEAIDRLRFVSTAFPATTYPHSAENTLRIESGYPQQTLDALREIGHTLEIDEGIFGNAGMIILSADGRRAELGVETRNETSSGRTVEPEP